MVWHSYCSYATTLIMRPYSYAEKRWKKFFHSTSDGLLIGDLQGRILSVNPAAIKILGCKNFAEISQRKMRDFSFKPSGPAIFNRLKKEKAIQNLVVQIQRKSGQKLFCEATINFIEENSVPLIEVIFRDITERIVAEKQLQREKEFSDHLIESANVFIIAFDFQGKVLIFNRELEETTGYNKEEILGENFIDILVPVEKKKDFWDFLHNLREQSISKYEAIFLTKEGKEIVVSWNISSLKDDENSTMGVLGVGHDITLSRKLMEQLTFIERLKCMGELIGGMAHSMK